VQPLAIITDAMIDVAALHAHVEDAAHGAIAQFVGIVRNHDHGRQVAELEYQVHPDALDTLRAILDEIAATYPDARIGAAHRFGALQIGDIAFAAVAASAHRDVAFTALRDVVERVKAELPIWKRQQFVDGLHEWVNFA
jgi:molybdopterin synthase catalytic subunit